jgi:hypothetical protein
MASCKMCTATMEIKDTPTTMSGFVSSTHYFFNLGWGDTVSPIGTSAANWPIVPAPDDR